MYRIEYDIETGLVHNLAIVEDENYPETLVDGVAYYEGDIPEDVEGYKKVLYYKLVNTQENPEGISTFSVWEGNLYAEYKPIEGWMELADAKDTVDMILQSQKPRGLSFAYKNNSIFAKSASALNLGSSDFTICFIASTGGSVDFDSRITGISNNITGANSVISIYNTTSSYGSNGIAEVVFEKDKSNGYGNNVQIRKKDNTKNLHHIVITRSGTLIKVIVNGRLVISKVQESTLDFSNFIYDIANTPFFYGGYIYNYALSDAEALELWNGGRYDDKVIPFYQKINYNITINEFVSTEYVSVDKITNGYRFTGIKKQPDMAASRPHILAAIEYNDSILPHDYLIKYKFKIRKIAGASNAVRVMISGTILDITIDSDVQEYSGRMKLNYFGPNLPYIYFYLYDEDKIIEITDLEVEPLLCLAEYKPENIRLDRMVNTGSEGSKLDLIYSIPKKPNIIYEAPYKDKIVLEDKTTPDFHPIAVGQRCYTSDGKILEAKLPVKGSEWAVSDWKQTSA